jgi:hypothetical protein
MDGAVSLEHHVPVQGITGGSRTLGLGPVDYTHLPSLALASAATAIRQLRGRAPYADDRSDFLVSVAR